MGVIVQTTLCECGDLATDTVGVDQVYMAQAWAFKTSFRGTPLPVAVCTYICYQWRRQTWGTCPLEFANARKFCRPNGRWLSLLDDFVTTNFGTRAPRARAPPP